MSESSQTATNAPAEPILCKMGCGFFGSAATGGCCSKCWRNAQKKNGEAAETAPSPSKPATPEAEAVPMEVDETPVVDAPKEETKVDKSTTVLATTPKKHKKKKGSYKNMMAGMLKSSSQTRDIEKEKEILRKVTGGGAFSKIEKI